MEEYKKRKKDREEKLIKRKIKKKKILISSLLIFLLLIILSGAIFIYRNKLDLSLGKDDYTVLIYVCGSNLETNNGAASKNIKEMLKANIDGNINVAIETGGARTWHIDGIDNDKITRWEIKDHKLIKLEKYDQENMGDSDTLKDFIEWGIDTYKSKNYSLILWNHGNACMGVCNDENYYYDSLNIEELNNALKNNKYKLVNKDFKFNFIGFDACLMSNLEALNVLSNYANYAFASCEIEPSGGWNYETFLSELSNNYDNKYLGEVVSKSYFEKSLSSKRSDIATMGAIDLENFDELVLSFDKLFEKLNVLAKETEGIKKVALGAKNAVKYGGNSDTEGFSNLVDIKTFAENIDDELINESKEKLLLEISKHVTSFYGGDKKLNSGGISFYYPLDINDLKLEEYFKICPCSNYVKYLKNTFTKIPKETIKFDDMGTIKSDGTMQIVLSKESLPYFLDDNFSLLEYNLDDDSDIITEIALGYDNDINYEKDSDGNRTGVYYSNLRGIWNSLNGYKLYNTIIEDASSYIIFEAPIILNGEKKNLRYSYTFDDSYALGGYYEILGVWQGIDKDTQVLDKELLPLNKDDVVEVYYPTRNLELGSNDAVSSSSITYITEKVIKDPNEEYEIREDGLDGEIYAYQYIITDIYGKKYYSNVGLIKMNETREQINSTVRLNNVYAGDFIKIVPVRNTYILNDEYIKNKYEFRELVNFIKQNRKYNKKDVSNSYKIKF